MVNHEQEEFLRSHRFGVITTTSPRGTGQSTPIYYLYEEAQIHISATTERLKTQNIQRDPRCNVCVLDEDAPLRYLTVYGRGHVTDDQLVERSRRIWSRFRDPLPDGFEALLREQHRIVISITPERAYPTLAPR